jgi:glycosyltransferase involved in cell wall biosynthesis
MILKEASRKIIYAFDQSRAKPYLFSHLAGSRLKYLWRMVQRLTDYFKYMDEEVSECLHAAKDGKLSHVESWMSRYSSAAAGRLRGETASFPKISIITPNYNQGRFLEECILSVLSQEYPNLELIIIDGGSDDNSLAIIKKYADKITYWVSERDGGQADAINKGLKFVTGEIFNWLNSDDRLAPGALHNCADAFHADPAAAGWIGGCIRTGEGGDIVDVIYPNGADRDNIGENWNGRQFYQPSCFLSTEKVRRIGGLNTDLYIALDLDLWIRILSKGKFMIGKGIWSIAINHADAKTQKYVEKTYLETAALQRRHGYVQGAESRFERVKGKPLGYIIPPSLRRRLAEVNSPDSNVLNNPVPFHEREHICFIGDFDSEEDINAVRFFLKEIFPIILRRNWVELHIIGVNAGKCGKLFHSHNIKSIDYVSNIGDMLMSYKLLVIPMTLRGGLGGKVGIAASAGLPIVTTSIGTEGFPMKDGEECFIADIPLEFGEKCNHLLRDAMCWHNFSLKSKLMANEANLINDLYPG